MPAYGSEFLWLVDFGPAYTGLGSGGTNTVKWSIRTKLDAALAGYDWTAGVLEMAGACGQYVVVVPANAFAAAGDYVLRCRTSDASTIYASQELIVSAPAPTAAAIAALPTDATIQADAAAAITADAKVTAIKGKTDLIPAAGPADAAYFTPARGPKLDNLDTAVTTRSSHSAADVWAVGTRALTDKAGFAPSAADNADAVWDEALSGHVAAGSAGKAQGYLDAAVSGIAAAVWGALTSGLTISGSIGKWIIDKIDVVLSTRSTYAGVDTAGTTTLLTRVPGVVQSQTGDAFARLGAPVLASISADIAAIPGKVDIDVAAIAADVTIIKDNTPRIR